MTLRAIEIVESCLNFFASVSKNDSTSRMFAAPAPQTRFAVMQTLGTLAFALPLRSRYSELLTLSILRVKISLSLTVFTRLRRREASRLE